LRRRGVGAHALAASEARLDHNAYLRKTVIAVSQSGRSADLLTALDVLSPATLIAVTNDSHSPLAERANLVLDVLAGPEEAVPASKSVTASAAVLLWSASMLGGDEARCGNVLLETARTVAAWLDSPRCDQVRKAAERIARRAHVAVLGSDYGQAVAREIALKLKEASYLHAEGFAAGEFRHGSVSMVDETFSVLGIVDRDALATVGRPLKEVKQSGALCYVIGDEPVDELERLGPEVPVAYNTLAWLVTGQLLALYAGRSRGIDSDHPRGLTKAPVNE
jgi:glucosamine--fructose-6-phosphate aminotransferase (isomerizing)